MCKNNANNLINYTNNVKAAGLYLGRDNLELNIGSGESDAIQSHSITSSCVCHGLA